MSFTPSGQGRTSDAVDATSSGDLAPETSPRSPEPVAPESKGPCPAPLSPEKQFELPEKFEDVVDGLMLSVHSRARMELNMLKDSLDNTKHYDFISHPFAEHLAYSVVYDLPDVKVYVPDSMLPKWGVSRGALFVRAFKNLVQRDCVFGSLRRTPGIYEATMDDSYDAARMLAPSFIHQLQVNGSYVVMVPHPNSLLVTGDRDAEGLKIMLERAEMALGREACIGEFAFRFQDDAWQPWTPGRSHPLHDGFRRCANRSLARYYDFQRDILIKDERCKLSADNLFVARFMWREDLDYGPSQSICTWTRHAPSMLPKTDAIRFVEGTESRGLVPWSVVARTMRDELEPMGFYPERYRVHSFPTAGQLAAMIREARSRGVPQKRPR